MGMSKRNILVGLSLMALAGLATVVVACSDDSAPDCPNGVVRIQVQLDLTTPLADMIVVESEAPPFTQTFKHTPSQQPGELFNVDLTFPAGGYPNDKLLTLLIRAYGQGQLIGETLAQLHTTPVCTVAGATLLPSTLDASPPDLYGVDGGGMDQ
jgi:hypothetical protein